MNDADITQFLDSKKSEGKFKMLVCKDDFAFGVFQFAAKVPVWLEANKYTAGIVPPTDPIILETGEHRPNPHHKLFHIEFNPIP